MIKRLFAPILAAAVFLAGPALAQNTKLAVSTALGAGGVYEVTTAGVTITLPSFAGAANPQPIIIKDATGNASPNITIAAPTGGTVDGLASVTLGNPNQGMVFEPFQGVWVTAGNYVAAQTGGGAAAAGSVGEVISSDIPTASAVSETPTGTPVNVTSISLTPGDWDCTGSVVTKPAGSTTTSQLVGAISTTTATLPTTVENGETIFQAPQTAGVAAAIPISKTIELLSATTTVYLVGQTSFAASTMSLYGQIICRRMR